ncbi:MAG: hypothetical protein ACI9MR_003400 [Myxococcota bacterium]|jgi:hypothetical protein
MSVSKIGDQLVSLCREGKNLEAVSSLYGSNAVSIEAAAPPGGERITKGLDAIKGKNKWWMENHEVHSSDVQGPFAHGQGKFAVLFDYDVTMKQSKQRMQMKEVAVYTVADDKITQEEFFYNM